MHDDLLRAAGLGGLLTAGLALASPGDASTRAGTWIYSGETLLDALNGNAVFLLHDDVVRCEVSSLTASAPVADATGATSGAARARQAYELVARVFEHIDALPIGRAARKCRRSGARGADGSGALRGVDRLSAQCPDDNPGTRAHVALHDLRSRNSGIGIPARVINRNPMMSRMSMPTHPPRPSFNRTPPPRPGHAVQSCV